MNKLFKIVVATILVTIPLYPKFPLLGVSGTFVSIRLEDMLLVVATIFLVFYLLKEKKYPEVFKSRISQSMLLYLIVGFVSLLSGILITQTVNPAIGLLHWIRRIEYFIPFFLGLYAVRLDKRNLVFFVNILLVVIAIVFIYGFGQKYYSWPIIITQNEEYSKGAALRYVPGGHINSTFAGHYDLGTFLIMAVPLFVGVFAFFKNKIKYLYLLGFLSGLWLLASSASRVSLVSYMISGVLTLILINKKIFIPMLLITAILFAGTSDNLVARYRRILEVSTQKFYQFNLLNYVVKESNAQVNLPEKKTLSPTPTSIPVFEDRSSNIRLNVEWPRAIRAFTKNPLLGTGYSSITLATDNDYLRALGEVGILGFAAFMLILVRLVLYFVKAFPFTKYLTKLELVYVATMFASIAGILLNAVFIDVFEASKFAIMFWLMMGFAVGTVTGSEKYAE